MRITLILAALLLTVGCTTLTPEEREYKEGQVAEKYYACRDWYERSGVVWQETEGRATHIRKNQMSTLDMKVSLKKHGCRRYLKTLGY